MQFSIGQGLSVRISMERIIKRKVKHCSYQSKIAMAYPHTVNASPLALSILIIHPTTSNLFFPYLLASFFHHSFLHPTDLLESHSIILPENTLEAIMVL